MITDGNQSDDILPIIESEFASYPHVSIIPRRRTICGKAVVLVEYPARQHIYRRRHYCPNVECTNVQQRTKSTAPKELLVRGWIVRRRCYVA